MMGRLLLHSTKDFEMQWQRYFDKKERGAYIEGSPQMSGALVVHGDSTSFCMFLLWDLLLCVYDSGPK
jgi:hypothetical protein